ncbi:hypothetical protein LTR37_016384 [Vermiconidia calcicola]|uniref:Uncharacterized protein n=1 Tax=Vermiconidia calcicola TaxID=1690605 RepID=A0ACC3MMX0_9PEZI|nr:hypothetical protein LTR37_016384 [Vermiconidia calcicola]
MAQDYGWQFSNALSTGPVASGSFIREATTTLVLSETNDPQTGNLALWPGMGTSGGDLIKALASQSWMAPTHAVRGLASDRRVQETGDYVTGEPGDHLTIKYKYNDSTQEYEQTVSLKGEVVSALHSGQAEGWGTAVECQSAACGFVPSHEYIDTELIMDVADPNYHDTEGTTGATGDIVTNDSGKTRLRPPSSSSLRPSLDGDQVFVRQGPRWQL